MGALRCAAVASATIGVGAAWTIAAACGGDGTSDASGPDSADPDARSSHVVAPPPDDPSSRDAGTHAPPPLPPPPPCVPTICTDADASTTELAAPNGGQIGGIAADGCNVYWADEGGNIRRVPRCGGAVTVIATAQPAPINGVTVDAYSVYWTAQGAIRSAGKDDLGGGPIATLAAAVGPWAIAVDDASVYWTEEPTSTGSVWTAPLAGGTANEIALTGNGSYFGLALDSDRVFFDHQGHVTSTTKDGGTPADLGAAGGLVGEIWCIAVDATYVYYTLYASGAVMRIPKTGGDAGVFASGRLTRCLAIDDANVYWVDDAPDGGLMRAPKDGGAPTAISSSPGGDEYAFVALDDTYVYWGYAGRIMRAPK